MAIDAWLTPATKSGEGNTNVNLTASKNTAASRSTIVTVSVSGIMKTMNCIQVEADKFTITISALTDNSLGSTITNIGDCSIGSSATDGVKTGTYYRDTIITLTATSAPIGYDFIGWYEGVNLVSSSLQFTVILTATRTLVAKYRIKSYTVNATSEDVNAGTVSPAGQTVEHGSNATITAYPKTAYNFEGWYNGATKVSSSLSYTFAVITNTNLTAKFIIKTFTTTTANNTGGTASVNVGNVNYDGSAIWTGFPSTGYHFLKWSNDSTVNPLTISNIVANTHITPIFEINYYIVTWNANGGNVSPASVVKTHGATLDTLPTPTRAATAECSYTFAGWFTASSGGSQINANTIITGNITYYAQWFVTINDYTITVNNGSGGGTYGYGTVVTLTANSIAHQIFTGWSDGVTTVSRQVTVTGNAIYTAIYKSDSHTIIVNSNGGGTVSGGGTFTHGTVTAIIASPSSGYHFVSWSDGGAQSHTVTVDSDKTITATFAQDPYLELDKTSLTFEASGGTQTVNITSNVNWSVS